MAGALGASSLHRPVVLQLPEHGGRAESYTEEQGQAVMDEDEITVRIDLQRGKAEATVYTCDLTHEYISINADYRS